MTYQQATDIVESIRSKCRFYGVSTAPLDSAFADIDDYMIFGRLGVAVIECVERPADAYYIQKVVFPAFVKRVFPPERGVDVDCSFDGCLAKLQQLVPQFYYDVISWPVSIR